MKNLFENLALEHRCRRTHAKAFAPVHKNNLVGVLARKIEFVGDDDNGVTILRGEAAQGFEKVHLRPDIEVQRRLVEKWRGQERLLRARARARMTRCFSPPEILSIQRSASSVAPTCASALLAMRTSSSDSKRKPPSIGMAALHHEFPGARRKQQAALLLDKRDTAGRAS